MRWLRGLFGSPAADDTFLWIRGMPFASITIGTAACLHLASGEPDAARDLVARASRRLSDCDLSDIPKWIDAIEQRRPELVVSAIREKRPEHLSAGPFGGLDGMTRAVWAARSRDSVAEAEAALAGARVTDSFAWLEDARCLGIAESRWRFGDAAGEGEMVRAFLRRQPLLLEPHWALRFGFIEYQERVRTEFWPAATDRAGARVP